MSINDLANPYAFTGRRLDDETGLYYYRNRYYGAELGRFVTRDPLRYVDGADLYRAYFVSKGTDPTGMDRYIIGDLGHRGLRVDTWNNVNGTWVNTGTIEWQFAAGSLTGSVFSPDWVLGLISWYGQITTIVNGTMSILETIPSTPEEDIALLNWMVNTAHPTPYSFLFEKYPQQAMSSDGAAVSGSVFPIGPGVARYGIRWSQSNRSASSAASQPFQSDPPHVMLKGDLKSQIRGQPMIPNTTYTVSDGELVLKLEPAEEGGYVVTCPFEPELITQAESLNEAFENAKDAMDALSASRKKLAKQLADAQQS